MNLTEIYGKTAKGLLFTKTRGKRLSKDLMQAFPLVDGKSTVEVMLKNPDAPSESALQAALEELLAEGYIKLISSGTPINHLTMEMSHGQGMNAFSVSDANTQAFHDAQAEILARNAIRERSKAESIDLQSIIDGAIVAASSENEEQEAEARKQQEENERKLREKLEIERLAREAATAREREKAEQQAKQAAEKKAQQEAEKKSREEAERVAREQAEARARQEAEDKVRQAAEEKKRREAEKCAAEEKVRQEAEQRAREEAEAKAKAEAGEQARREAEKKARQEVEQHAREEAEAKARAEAEEQAHREAAEKAKLEAERVAHEEAEAKSRQERRLAARAREEAEAKARAEAEEQARRKAEEIARQEAEQKRLREEAEAKARAEAEEDARLKAEEEARQEAELERIREEAKAKAKAEAEEQARQEAEQKRIREEAEAKAKAEEDARLEAELKHVREEAEAKAGAEAEEQAHIQAKEKAEQEAIRIEAEARAKAEAEEQTRIQAEKEAEEEAAQRIRDEAEARARAEALEQARREGEEEARLEAELEAEQRRIHEEAEARARQEEEQARRKAEDEALIALEVEEQKRLEAEETARREAEKIALEKSESLAREREEKAAREADKARKALEAQEKARARSLAVSQAKNTATVLLHSLPWKRIISAAFILLVVIPLVLLHLINLSFLIEPAQKLASERLQDPVTIQSVRASLWPAPHFRLEGVAIGEKQEAVIPAVLVTPVLSSLTEETKQMKSVEIESLALTNDMLARLPVWFADSKRSTQLEFPAIDLKNASLSIKGISLPSFNARAAFNSEGRFVDVRISDAEDKLDIVISPAENALSIVLKARDWKPLLGLDLHFASLDAEATADRQSLKIKSFDGLAFDGRVTADGKVRWDKDWRAEGDFKLAHVQLSKVNPALAGKMEASGSYAFSSTELGKLFSAPQIRASFKANEGRIAGIDLARAIKPEERREVSGGETTFSELSGAMTYADRRYQFNQVKMIAGLLRANADFALSQEQVSGRISVSLESRATAFHTALTLSGAPQAPVLKK
ncbi:MAG: hypothetical protein Q8O37_02445 [Sulfuricellaceae bacterium]|nr:hypothetical protein [Sulfuricellaceae bacterium]